MSDERRSEIGDSDEPVEDEVVESFDAIVEEGAERLNRTWAAVLVTGLSGGIEIGVGVMAYLAVLHETGSHLLAGVAFSAGFIALLLARSELFTENFLVPIAALAAKEGTPAQLAKLWIGTLIANLMGGWLVMLLVVAALPALRSTLVESARHYLDVGFGWEGVCLALLGGMAITLMTRMQHGTDSDVAKIAAAVVGGLLLAGLQLMHSVLDSLLIFGAITLGEADLGEWVRWFVPTLVLNVVGGILLVTVLRLIRSKELLAHARR
ncbi:formate/nitrite transporter family protein [Amnibacterium kyonggiense]|uniref:Formate/nitrite transporter FocA (FNT family) n=1 Tax=Amnibacterium kyonggiense TaxID=595671 RepID=A0A4R7FRM3_9MICO|nr:formate/nitrite transporter family protein [Amnibacterium kyonggiense]TDS80299.1 formate/nitrite transporter FocA (FNT family) [Amnibacterium kyonggiense]